MNVFRDLPYVDADVLEIVLVISLLVNLALLVLLFQELRLSGRKLRALRAQVNRTSSGRAIGAAEWAVRNMVGTAVRVREQGVSGMLRSSIEELTGLALEDRREIDRVAGPDGHVTILFSDIEDSTSLNERLGDDAFVRILERHNREVRAMVAKEHGHIVKSQGDGFMIAFREPAAAVRVATAMQQAIHASNRGRRVALVFVVRRTPILVRVGIHTGQVVARDGDYFGLNVAMAARVAAQAAGGEILVTDGVRDKLDEGLVVLTQAHRAELKGIPGDHQLWSVDWTTA